MKHRILKTSLFLLILFCVFSNFSTVSATYTQNDIPEIMQPYSVIEYTSDSDFKVVKGGFLNSKDLNKVKSEIKNNEIVAQKTLERYFPNEKINTDFSEKEKISPVKGMEVTYASDGLVFSITYPENVENPLEKESNKQLRGPILPEGILQVRSWGSYPNNLYVNRKTNKIVGTGRATTYEGLKGQGNHILKKGDIATKLSHDNCKLGIGVSVTSNSKAGSGSSLTKIMKKWDAGGMPNAIVDIWKTGVEYWGYKYKDLLSLKGVTTIEHDNVDIEGNKLY